MNYIISPWVFYILGVIETVQIVCVVFLMVFGLVFGIYALFWFIDFGWSDGFIHPNKIFKMFRIPVILSILFLIFSPSRQTCYEMLIASKVTGESISEVKGTINDIADYIVEAAKDIKAEGTE